MSGSLKPTLPWEKSRPWHWRPTWAGFALLLVLGTGALASESGGIQSPFDLGFSARSLGLGGAIGALGDEAASGFQNPGTLAYLQRQELVSLHSSLFVDTTYDGLAYARPDGRGTLLAAFQRINTKDIPLTTDSIQALGTFNVLQLQGSLGYGVMAYRGIGFGILMKYVRQSFPPESDSGFGLDLGLAYRFETRLQDRSSVSLKNLSFGLAVSNLVQPEIRIRDQSSTWVRMVKPSLGYRIQSKGGQGVLSLALAADVAHGSNALRAGVEYAWKRLLFLRGGYGGIGPTLGAGLRIGGFLLDWAMDKRDLGTSQRFSLSYRFGSLKDPRAAQRLAALKYIAKTYEDMESYPEALRAWSKVKEEFPEDPDPDSAKTRIDTKRAKAIQENLRVAREIIQKNDLVRAIPYLTRAMNLDPQNQEVQALLKQADAKTFMSQNYLSGLEAYNQGNYKDAVDFFEVVYRRDPSYRDVARLWSDAKSHYSPLEAMPESLSKLYGKGVAEFLRGDYPKAIEIWRKVLETDPTNFLVQRNIAEAQARMKEAALAKPAAPEGKR